MPVFTEGRHAAEFVMSEANRQRSRDNITVAAGEGILKPGAVLGQVSADGKYRLTTVAAVDGSETAAAVLLYEVDATSADVDVAAITRDAEVNRNLLSYGADVDTQGEKDAKHADLAAVGIIVR